MLQAKSLLDSSCTW